MGDSQFLNFWCFRSKRMLSLQFSSFSGTLRGLGSLVNPLRTIRFLGIRFFFFFFVQLQTTQPVLLLWSCFWSQSMRNLTYILKMALPYIRLWSIPKLWRHLYNMVLCYLIRTIVLKGLDKKLVNLNFLIFGVFGQSSCYRSNLVRFLSLWEV